MNTKYFDEITIEYAENGILVYAVENTDIASFKSRPRVFTDFDEFVDFLHEKICDETKYSEIKPENIDKELFGNSNKEYGSFVKVEFAFPDNVCPYCYKTHKLNYTNISTDEVNKEITKLI